MKRLMILSASQQTAEHIRSLILEGEFSNSVPGAERLADSLGVNTKTVESAFKILEKEGVLLNQGPGRKRLVQLQSLSTIPRKLRIGILAYEKSDESQPFLLNMIYALSECGHRSYFVSKNLLELKMDVARVERFVAKENCDAWLIIAGSRDVLQWFSEQSLPAFALYGRRMSLDMPSAGSRNTEAFVDGIQHLIELGHRRIVKICREDRRLPIPGHSERLFLDRLKENGIPAGDYNLPSWVETPAGFYELLESLFETTPPTALIFDESPYLFAAMQFFGKEGIRVPEDVSVFCLRDDLVFDWSQPAVACLRWKEEPIVRRVLRWAKRTSLGKPDKEGRLNTPSQFIKGGTIAPPLSSSDEKTR